MIQDPRTVIQFCKWWYWIWIDWSIVWENLITFDTVEQTAKVHQVIKFLLDLFLINWHESVAALSVADFWRLIKNYKKDNLDMIYPESLRL